MKNAASATVKGDAATVAREARFVARTMVEDAAFAARARMTLLRATMGRGIKR